MSIFRNAAREVFRELLRSVTYDPGADQFCPFLDHTWDNSYAGDEIVELQFPQVGDGTSCLAGLPTLIQSTALEPCGSSPLDGGKEWWVIGKGDFFNSVLLNVYLTNDDESGGKVEVLTGSTTAGDRPTIAQWVDSGAQNWGYYPGLGVYPPS
jgi:hypothetical protein